MTQTYHDIEAVTQLLQEKERDLELSARIGQSLLQQNRFLDEKASHLEELLNQSQDKISQIRHELKQKTDLLHVFIHEDDESSDGVSIEDVENFDPFSCTETCQTKCRTPASVLELLRKRIDNLESENLMLKSDQVSIQSEADTYEEREKKLISECVKQLNTAHSEMLKNREEIDRKTDILHRYQEEKTQLLSQLVDVQKKYNQISVEYEEVMCNLHAAKDCQQELTQELSALAAQYEQCMRQLQETRSELRRTQRPSIQTVLPAKNDSIASELEVCSKGNDVQVTTTTCDSFNRIMSLTRLGNRHRRDNLPGSNTGSLEAIPSTSSSTTVPNTDSLARAIQRLSRCRRLDVEHKMRQYSNQNDIEHSNITFDSSHDPDDSLDEEEYLPFTNRPAKSPFVHQKLQIVKPIEGSLTLNHWRKLANPEIASFFHQPSGVLPRGGYRAFNTKFKDSPYNMDEIEEDNQPSSLPFTSNGLKDSATAVIGKFGVQQLRKREVGLESLLSATKSLPKPEVNTCSNSGSPVRMSAKEQKSDNWFDKVTTVGIQMFGGMKPEESKADS